MENIIFERNYENRDEDSFCSAVLEQALSGGFFEAYGEMVDKIPKSLCRRTRRITTIW